MLGSNTHKSPKLPPSPSTPSNHGPKLPKFLQKQGRDRSRSLNEYAQTVGGSITTPTASMASSSSSSITNAIGESPIPPSRRQDARRTNKLKGLKESYQEKSKDDDNDIADESMEETPVIIEPSTPYHSRALSRLDRSEASYASDSPSTINHISSSSSQRFSDIPTRLSGWFAHTFSASTTDLSLPSILSQASLSPSSPKSKALGNLISAARNGKDRAIRYLLDSDATPDKCPDPIWLLGVQHQGYEPPIISPSPSVGPATGRRASGDLKRSASTFRTSARSSAIDSSDEHLSSSQSSPHRQPPLTWPASFYSDFTSRIWLTYRSHFLPIRDNSLAALDTDTGEAHSSSPTP